MQARRVKKLVNRNMRTHLRRILFLLSILVGMSVLGLPSRSGPRTALRLHRLVGVWNQGAAIADLDGDGRPDLAVVREAGSTTDGLQYRIELHLTTRHTVSFLNVGAEQGGLRIVPRDVDGDRDLDLVITGAQSYQPVGIWLNDSTGGFTRDEAHGYPRTLWTEIPADTSPTPQHYVQAPAAAPSRSVIATPYRQALHIGSVSLPRPRPPRMVLPVAPIDQQRTRAPPLPLA